MSRLRTALGMTAVLMTAALGGAAQPGHGGHGGHAGGFGGGHGGAHFGVPHATPRAAPMMHTNHPASASFGRIAAPQARAVGSPAGFRLTSASTAFAGASRFPVARTSTPYRLVMGQNGYQVHYPTLGTSRSFTYGNGFNRGFISGNSFGGFGGFGGYPYYGFGTGLSNFGYALSYPPLGIGGYGGYGYGGAPYSYPAINYGGSGYGGSGYGGYPYADPGLIAGGGPVLIRFPQAIPAAAEAQPPAPGADAAPAGSASVTVLVPEGGQVWFDNALTQKGGTKWVYSAAVPPGKTQTLAVKARWTENGQDRDLDVPVKLRTGDAFTIDVTKVR